MGTVRFFSNRGLWVVLCWLPATVVGQVAYQQLPANTGQGVRSDGEIANPGFFQRLADDFVLPAPASITGVDWWGGSENFAFQNLTNITSIKISIYSNGPGNIPVEPPLFTQTFPKAALTVTPTCTDFLLGGYEYRFSVDLATPVAIPAGQKHWIHVGAILTAFNLDSMLWSQATGGNNVYSADSAPNDGIWQGPLGSPLGDFAFRLRTAAAPVCDPKDANCDGTFTIADIQAFVNAALSPSTAHCSPCAADINNDGVTDGRDIQSFACSYLQTP